MKKLTAKQERFAQLVVAGETQSAAYRMAYRSKASAKVIAVDASRLAANPSVAARIAELQAQAVQGAVWTLKSRLAALVDIARDPTTSPSECIRAILVYTQLAGDMPEQKTAVHVEGELAHILAALKPTLGLPSEYLPTLPDGEGDRPALASGESKARAP